MRRRLLSGAGGLALTILLISGDPASAADPSARLGRLNCEAGDVAEFDGQRWVCAPHQAGAPVVLLDANGEQFGTILDINFGNFEVVVDIIESFVRPSRNDMVDVFLRVSSRNSIDAVFSFGELHYESDDCTGPPFLLPTIPVGPTGGTLFGLSTPAVILAPSSEVAELWVATTDTSQQAVLPTKFSPTFGCEPFSVGPTSPYVGPAFPAELVDPNLYETFPPPYTLELQDGR